MPTWFRKGRAMGDSTECGLAILRTLPLRRHSERSEESRARRGFMREGKRVFVADAVRPSSLGEGESLLEARFFAQERKGFRGVFAPGWGRTTSEDHRAEIAQNDGVVSVSPVEGAGCSGYAVPIDTPHGVILSEAKNLVRVVVSGEKVCAFSLWMLHAHPALERASRFSKRHSTPNSAQNSGRGWPFGVISNVLLNERK